MDADATLPGSATPQPPKLLDRLRAAALADAMPVAVADDFVQWGRRYILFQGVRHPADLTAADVTRFLAEVVRTAGDPLPALDRARRALDFLYRRLLGLAIGEVVLPKPPRLLDQMRQVLRVRNHLPRTEGRRLHLCAISDTDGTKGCRTGCFRMTTNSAAADRIPVRPEFVWREPFPVRREAARRLGAFPE